MPLNRIQQILFIVALAVTNLWGTATAQSKCADTAPPPPKAALEKNPRFIRVLKQDDGQLVSLDTAIARYEQKRKGKPTVVVDLIGAVHIGDQTYYDRLDERFKNYDVLLYELVAPKGTRIPANGRRENASPVSALQGFMKNLLQLEFQLEQIDYQAKNFVHADMSPEQFWESMQEKNESPLSMFLSMMRASLAQQADKPTQVNDAMLLAAIFDRKNGPMVLKRAMAEELGNNDVMLDALNGPDGSTIVTERNKVALQVMKEQIDAGKRKIGVFYGAAHLKDMHHRLLDTYDMKLTGIDWVPAWELMGTSEKKESTETTP
ncbi:MAG: hypothetical protein HUJ26_01680 [Planctomycetaceae bacterium]|nr:hypothetical protein [Planctomycetaceae bacterium]